MKDWVLILVTALNDGSITTEHVATFDINLDVNTLPKQESCISLHFLIKNLYVYRNLYKPNISDPVITQPTDIAIQNP